MTKASDKKKTTASQPQASSILPLFYKRPVPLDKKAHANASLASDLSFNFASNVNAVPVTMIELPDIMQFYPIAFSSDKPATPLAILGLRANENLFVNEKGQWMQGTYIPAYIRRYPFIFARNDAGDRLTLCVDDAPGVLTKGDKNPLFDKEGEMGALTKSALDFCRSYQAAADQTQEFSNALEAANILIDRHAEVRMQDGSALTLSGFRQVDEKKYYELPEATILEWHKRGWTRFIYAHILSTGSWQRLFALMEARSTTGGKKK